MSRSAFTSDPRSIITPDAFEVDRKLLGFPLASPTRRALAILVDLVIVGLLTTLPGILLGIVAAALFFRIWGKSEKGDPLERAFKWAMGCFGAFVLLVTVIVVLALRTSIFSGAEEAPRQASGEATATPEDDAGSGEVIADLGLGDLIGNAPALVRLRDPVEALKQTDSPDEAQPAAEEIVRTLQGLGVGRERMREVLEEVAGPAPPWGDREEVFARALASVEIEPATTSADSGEGEPLPEAAGDATAEAAPSRVFSPEAEDSFMVLRGRVSDLEGERADLREELRGTRGDLRRARAEAQEVESGGLLSRLVGFVDELGWGFGWGSLYMTIVMAWWKGQTVGKRLFNIRVVRLDGEPIGWFVAFERAGGYAAGFATGLLGFAQVWWDPNRQAIHDKIVGTVVIKDGEDRVPGPWMLDEDAESEERR